MQVKVIMYDCNTWGNDHNSADIKAAHIWFVTAINQMTSREIY